MSPLPKFNQVAADAEAARNSWGDAEYIKYFKDGYTTIRVAPESGVTIAKNGMPARKVTGTAAWQSNKNHFKDGIGSWPCPKTESNKDAFCSGCLDESVNSSGYKVSSAGDQFYFHALDDQGYIHSYKCNWEVYEKLQNREARIGDISDRDYTIHKFKGGNNKVMWEIEVADVEGVDHKRDIDWDTYDYQDLDLQRGAEWLKAAEHYGLDDEGKAFTTDAGNPWDGSHDEPAPDFVEPAPAPTGKANGVADVEGAKPSTTVTVTYADGSNATIDWSAELPDDTTIEVFDIDTLRRFLKSEEQEVAPRAGKAMLIKQAKAYVGNPPPF
jgi:hypothetical protein